MEILLQLQRVSQSANKIRVTFDTTYNISNTLQNDRQKM